MGARLLFVGSLGLGQISNQIELGQLPQSSQVIVAFALVIDQFFR